VNSTVTDLVDRLEKLPVQKSAALQVVRLAGDAETSAGQLAKVAAADPALAARILKMANSAYLGLSGRVGTLQFAVTVLGFLTVRSLAATAAAGVTSRSALPPGFWPTSTATAVAAGLIAPRVGARRDDAFCAGILAEIGLALIHQVDPAHHQPLVRQAVAAGRNPCDAEREAYGVDHAAAGAAVLRAWRFPEELCAAVASHHGPGAPKAPLERTLRAGRAVASRLPGTILHDPCDIAPDALLAARLTVEDGDALAQQAADETASLAAAFRP